MPSFEFDRAKAAANLEKHRVSFDEAITVFNDPWSGSPPFAPSEESDMEWL